MPKFSVTRHIEVKRSKEELVDYLTDFTTWPAWSPWLVLEPSCEVQFSNFQQQAGANYSWNGQRVGQGSMTLSHVSEDQIDLDLEFIRPFKTSAKAQFVLSEGASPEHTLVEWTMNGSVPWFLFFLKGFFRAMVGMDYDRGLRMLKSVTETGDIPSELSDLGEQILEDTHYVGLKASGTIKDLPQLVEQQMAQINDYCRDNKLPVCGPPFLFYHEMKMSTEWFEFSTCLPVSKPISASAPFESGHIPACQVYMVEHKGKYDFLGNAWSYLSSVTRQKKFKLKSKPLGLEKYINSPQDVNPDELVTQVMMFKR